MGLTYREAGVDIAAGEAAVKAIKGLAQSTYNDNVLTELGLFGGCYQIPLHEYEEPVLVASTDGVGTKLLIALAMDKHDTVGQCLVNHCVNDILTTGARPLFFLDYIGTGKLKPETVKAIVRGIAQACRENRCALIGGEMAEMPDLYRQKEYDLVGTIVGITAKNRLLIKRVQPGDVLIGLPSTGLHTNGYTLARKVLLQKYHLSDYLAELGMPLGAALLQVHRSYLPYVEPLLSHAGLHAMSHITGGGIIGNTMRVIPQGCELFINWSAWEIPPLFQIIQKIGELDWAEMRRVFNLGIGFILIVAKTAVTEVLNILRERESQPIIIGEVRKGEA
jgi:phosphoribosylformylglycinamidine cyclo-ligase